MMLPMPSIVDTITVSRAACRSDAMKKFMRISSRPKRAYADM
jgi:hypothetical protein